jgi:hypothetical protein
MFQSISLTGIVEKSENLAAARAQEGSRAGGKFSVIHDTLSLRTDEDLFVQKFVFTFYVLPFVDTSPAPA